LHAGPHRVSASCRLLQVVPKYNIITQYLGFSIGGRTGDYYYSKVAIFNAL
jgi:hypothetical protein